jgi:hypothetical protein
MGLSGFEGEIGKEGANFITAEVQGVVIPVGAELTEELQP